MAAKITRPQIGQDTLVQYPMPTSVDSQRQRIDYLLRHLDDEILGTITGGSLADIQLWRSESIKITDRKLQQRLLTAHRIVAGARSRRIDDEDIQCWFSQASLPVEGDPGADMTPAEAIGEDLLSFAQHFAARTLYAHY